MRLIHIFFLQEIYEAKSPKVSLVKTGLNELLQVLSMLMPSLREVLEPGLSTMDDKAKWTRSSNGNDDEVSLGVLIGKTFGIQLETWPQKIIAYTVSNMLVHLSLKKDIWSFRSYFE